MQVAVACYDSDMKTKRVQNPKPRNEALARAMRDKRQGSAAQPHKNKSKYDRKNKSWKGEW